MEEGQSVGGRGGEGANKSVNHRASPSGPSAVNPRPLLMPQARHAFVPASEATSIEADRCGGRDGLKQL